jgi:hypothetical protein
MVNTSIKRSYLWKHFEILKLTKNTRLTSMAENEIEKTQLKDFANLILNIGNGTTTSPEGEE